MKRLLNRIFVAGFALFVLAFSSGTAAAQYKGNPVKKDKLLSVLRARQLQTREIVGVIKTNGVDFRVDDGSTEAELVGAGARPEVIVAARENYRGGAAVATVKAPVKSGGTPTSSTGKFSGKPLDKASILNLLDNDVAEAQIVKNIQARGVSYYQSARDRQDIRSAGGSAALVSLIDGSFAGSAANSQGNDGPPNGPTVAGGEDDGFVDISADSSPAALQRAIADGTAPAQVYQQLGVIALKNRNLMDAERNYREAINKGGSGVIAVAHDHFGRSFSEYCQGNLFIAKDIIRFESYDNIHTFETSTSNIKKSKMNSGFGALLTPPNVKGVFLIELQTGEKDSKNYTFAPMSGISEESKMALRLIGK